MFYYGGAELGEFGGGIGHLVVVEFGLEVSNFELESLDYGKDTPASALLRGHLPRRGRGRGRGGVQAMCLMTAVPNSEHLTLVAPSIMRWKS